MWRRSSLLLLRRTPRDTARQSALIHEETVATRRLQFRPLPLHPCSLKRGLCRCFSSQPSASGGKTRDDANEKLGDDQRRNQHHRRQRKPQQYTLVRTNGININKPSSDGVKASEASFLHLDRAVQGNRSGYSQQEIAEQLTNSFTQWQEWFTQLPPGSPLAQAKSPWSTDHVWERLKQYQVNLTNHMSKDELDRLLIGVYNIILIGYLTECQRQIQDPAVCLRKARSLVEEHMISNGIKPNAKSYKSLLEIHAIAEDMQAAMDVLDYILRVETASKKQGDASDSSFRLDYSVFETLLQACADLPSKERGLIADNIMQRMMRLSDNGLLSSRPQVCHFTQCMDAWAKSEHPHAGKRTREIWEYLNHAAHKEKKWWLKPDTVSFLTVLHALARLGQAEEAEHVLLQACQDPTSMIKPDLNNFNAVLDAWSKAKSRTTGERAEKLLRQMMSDNNAWGRRIEPDLISYSSVIHAWGVSGHPDAGNQAERLFEELNNLAQSNPDMEPNTWVYNSLINAWARGRNAAKAAAVLEIMCHDHQTGKSSKAEPSIDSFSSVLNAHAQAKDPHGAEHLLRKLEDSGIPNILPTTILYNTVINSWATTGHVSAGHHAERLLREMQDLQDDRARPNLRTYNTVISAYARTGQGGEDAERLLKELQAHPILRPERITYNSVINAWAKQGNPERAEALLEEMRRMGGDMAADVVTLTTCMEAWSRSGRAEGGEKADWYLREMKPFPEKGQRLATRYKIAKVCWENSATAGNPTASQRIQELGEVIEEILGKS